MPRSVWKGPFCDNYVLKLVKRAKPGSSSMIKIRSRRSVILPMFVGYVFGVKNPSLSAWSWRIYRIT